MDESLVIINQRQYRLPDDRIGTARVCELANMPYASRVMWRRQGGMWRALKTGKTVKAETGLIFRVNLDSH